MTPKETAERIVEDNLGGVISMIGEKADLKEDIANAIEEARESVQNEVHIKDELIDKIKDGAMMKIGRAYIDDAIEDLLVSELLELAKAKAEDEMIRQSIEVTQELNRRY